MIDWLTDFGEQQGASAGDIAQYQREHMSKTVNRNSVFSWSESVLQRRRWGRTFFTRRRRRFKLLTTAVAVGVAPPSGLLTHSQLRKLSFPSKKKKKVGTSRRALPARLPRSPKLIDEALTTKLEKTSGAHLFAFNYNLFATTKWDHKTHGEQHDTVHSQLNKTFTASTNLPAFLMSWVLSPSDPFPPQWRVSSAQTAPLRVSSIRTGLSGYGPTFLTAEHRPSVYAQRTMRLTRV